MYVNFRNLIFKYSYENLFGVAAKMIDLFTTEVDVAKAVFGSQCRSSSKCPFYRRIFEACHSITKIMAFIELQATKKAHQIKIQQNSERQSGKFNACVNSESCNKVVNETN